MSDTETKGSSPKLFEIKRLPSDDWARQWEQVVIDPTWRRRLQNYGLLFATGKLSQLDCYRLISYEGGPGLGKTMLAHGFANYVALQVGGLVYALNINAEEWRNPWLGEAPKRVKKAFDQIRFLAQQAPVIPIIDEAEQVVLSRSHTLKTAEPSDVQNAVNELLVQVDRLRDVRNTMIIVTTNLTEAIDAALLDRADIRFEFSSPNCETREKILTQDFARFRERGIMIDVENVAELAEVTEGFSGRQLTRLCLWGLLEKEDSSFVLEISDLLRAVRMMKPDPTPALDLVVPSGHSADGHNRRVHSV